MTADQVEEHRDIMHSETPGDILNVAGPPQLLPFLVEMVDLPDLPFPEEPLDKLNRRLIEQEMTHHQDALVCLRQIHQLLGFARGERHRLLDEDVLPRPQAGGHQFEVGRHRRRDRDRIAVSCDEVAAA